MKIITFIENKFWIPLSVSILLGLFLPYTNNNLTTIVIPVFMLIFFLACLKIDLLDVIKQIRKPLFIFYILLVYLLIIPAVLFFLFRFIQPEIAVGVLLLVACPPGTVSPVLTDIFKGKISLSLAIAITAYLISPFTVFLLFYYLTKTTIHLDLIKLFESFLFINFIPLIAAHFLRKPCKSLIEKTKRFYGFTTIICISIVIYIVIAGQAKEILSNPTDAVVDILWMYLVFAILYTLSYFIAFWKNKNEKVAIAVTKTYMNNALAIGLAAAFFNPKIALLMVLSEIPWATTLSIFKYITKYLH